MNNSDREKYLSEALSKVCKVWVKAKDCMDRVECTTDEGKKERDELNKKFLKTVEGGCEPDGTLSPCAKSLAVCTEEYQTAKYDLDRDEYKIKFGCTQLIEYDQCVEKVNEESSCPTSDVLAMVKMEEALTKEAREAGCGVGCVKLLSACSFELERAPENKEQFCKAYKDTKACMEHARSDAGCQKESTQKHLQWAINLRKSKLTEKDCDGATSVTVSAVLLVSTVLASFLGRQL